MANRVFIGDFDGSGDYRFRVSRPGLDVMDPTLTGNDLAFDSASPKFGIILFSGSAAITSGRSVTINLPYTFDVEPFVMVNFDKGDGRYVLGNNMTDGQYPLVNVLTDSFTVWRGRVGLTSFCYHVLNRPD